LPVYLRGGLLSLCNTGPLAVKRQIVCIHDVNTRLAPNSYSLTFRMAYRLLEPGLGRTARQITTVSRFSELMLRQFNVTRTKDVAVIHDGHEHVFEWDAGRSSIREPDLALPYVLVVGSKAPHKNLAIVYSFATDLAAKGIHIFVTGGENLNVFARDQGAQPPPNVRHLGRVNDDDLAFLYGHALCLAFPSKTEGFGLPTVEAMALGCPVISSDVASLPEVCGDAALYAMPDDAASWVDAVGRIADDPILRENLSKGGRERAKTFSWKKGAEKYLELMYQIDSSS
jgi:glycosyltransferase involved in cell wall biosynthesis